MYLASWGSYGSGNGQFLGPAGAAIDVAGDVFVADYSNHRVQVFNSAGVYLRQFGGIAAVARASSIG